VPVVPDLLEQGVLGLKDFREAPRLFVKAVLEFVLFE
jgi:hypothetical protein